MSEAKMRRVRELQDLVIDEISLVDKGANQHARVTIAKRHGEEDRTMEEFYDGEGNVVDLDSLAEGDVVYDAEGQGYEFSPDEVEEQELEPVGKSANPFLETQEVKKADGPGLQETIREALSKAYTDDERDEVISKALGQLDEISKRAEAAEAAAESERDLRLTREYTEVAKNYNVGVDADELGPVLMRAAEALSHDDCVVIAKALDSASEANALLEEIGTPGLGSNSDVLSGVDSLLEEVGKSADFRDVEREELVSKYFEQNPEAYDEYLSEQRSGR